MERIGYQSLSQFNNNKDANVENDEGPPDEGAEDVMVHIVPDTNKNTRWIHIEDLDAFFTRIYYYHQSHGFLCIILKEILELFQFIFVVGFATYLLNCVDYQVLFRNKPIERITNTTKITIGDVVIPLDDCISDFSGIMWIILFIAFVFWCFRFVQVIYNTYQNWDIRAFYKNALNIPDSNLDNLTWYDVQKLLRDVQREQQMCIHKQDLSELDIYHRILRFKNYMVAMVNKNLLPLKFKLPIFGETVFLTHGMKINLEWILFWGPGAPFENSWHLKEDYKKVAKRKELANTLSKRILWIGIFNLAFSPVIFLWQILYSFFNYAEVVKREPGTLGMRRWSLYGKLYLRHFNELEHELDARLARGYRPAAKYMNIFNSPFLTIIAQNLAFITGAIFAVLSLLAIYDEDVVTVEHILLILTVLGAISVGCRSFIPDEHQVFCPERLLTAVLAHVHYFPDHWKGQAHTTKTRDDFSILFQYKSGYLIEELLSPFITPIILIFYLRPKSLDIVDFYRNFSVEVVGVGDVCSFAQMDVRKHGNPTWQNTFHDNKLDNSTENKTPNSYTQAEIGKTELSLIHFKHTNPFWKGTSDAEKFIYNLKERANKDASNLPTVIEENYLNPLFASLNSLSSLGNEYSNIVTNLIRENEFMNHHAPLLMSQQVPHFTQQQLSSSLNLMPPPPPPPPPQLPQSSLKGFINKHEGPIQQQGAPRGIASGSLMQQSVEDIQNPVSSAYNMISFANSFAQNPNVRTQTELINNTFEGNSIEMSLDLLYLHELHHLGMRRKSRVNQSIHHPGPSSGQPNIHFNSPNQTEEIEINASHSSHQTEKTPLLSTTFFRSS